MPKLTHDTLMTAWYVLYDLEQEDEARTWEIRVLKDARQIVNKKLKAVSPGEESDGPGTTINPHS